MASQNDAPDKDKSGLVRPLTSPEHNIFKTKSPQEAGLSFRDVSGFSILKQCANCNLNSTSSSPCFNSLDFSSVEARTLALGQKPSKFQVTIVRVPYQLQNIKKGFFINLSICNLFSYK